MCVKRCTGIAFGRSLLCCSCFLLLVVLCAPVRNRLTLAGFVIWAAINPGFNYVEPAWYHGYQWQKPAIGHTDLTPLGKALMEFFASERRRLGRNISVVELGCGYGKLVYNLNRVPGVKAFGVDGHTSMTNTLGSRYRQGDLRKHIPISADYTMSFEAGEHVPQEHESTFLRTLRQARVGIVLGWARPGQGGQGHINERSQDYLIGKMTARRVTAKQQPQAGEPGQPGPFRYAATAVSQIHASMMDSGMLKWDQVIYYSNTMAFLRNGSPPPVRDCVNARCVGSA